jgi:hypothetical protein
MKKWLTALAHAGRRHLGALTVGGLLIVGPVTLVIGDVVPHESAPRVGNDNR